MASQLGECACYFKSLTWLCDGTSDGNVSTAGPVRIRTVIASSKLRGDNLHIELEHALQRNEDYSIECHRNCVSTYTSKSHIKRHMSRLESDTSRVNTPPLKRTCRSSSSDFDFRSQCIFCGEVCQMEPDRRHKERWRRVIRCRTAEHGYGKCDFKQAILDVCTQRKDDFAEHVRIRVQGAVSDLHAADAMYHKDCSTSFMAPRSVKAAFTESPCVDDQAFDMVVKDLKNDPSRIWNSVDVHKLYMSYEGSSLLRRPLMAKLMDYFGQELLVLSGNGVANILVFRSKAASVLRLVDDDEDDVNAAIDKVAKHIVLDCKDLKQDARSYNTRINLDEAIAQCSPTLLSILQKVSTKLNSSMTSALIGNIVTSVVTHQATTLQVALGILLREKSLIVELHHFGVSCSYDEVLRFKASAASAASDQSNLRGIMDCKSGLVQAVADNFDANISSANGLRSTHALALLITQVQNNAGSKLMHAVSEWDNEPIKRLKKEAMTDKLESKIVVQRYNGPKKPEMPQRHAIRAVLPLKILASQQVTVGRANNVDFVFLKSVTYDPTTPEFGGFNTRMAREQGQYVKPSTKAMYTPLIDMVPSDPDTMMTAMIEATRLTHETGQAITIFTADQQLYRVVVDITWFYPDIFSKFVPRLGGMHMLMSFIGAIGTLMSNSGLEDILKVAFGGVSKMLLGKKFPQNCRALRMITEELLCETINTANSYTNLMELLEERATQSRTAKLWVDNLIKPVFVMMTFIRAEREGDWPLHLWTVTEMIPYFFAAGHSNYARYGLYYLRSMEKLPSDVQDEFMRGSHVMRHKPGLWNAIWSDMFIETTFMRYGHGPGGIIGITLEQSALTKWALSLHICSRLMKDVASMTEDIQEDITTHKEEMPSRIKSDNDDRKKLRSKLQSSIDPLDPTDHPSTIINIVTGRIAPDTVTADQAVSIGMEQQRQFELSWPEGFHKTISKKVVTMSVLQKHVKVGHSPVYDTNLIYSRVIGLQSARNISMKDVLEYELSPVPTSMYQDNGDMRITKSKSVLKRKLQVEHSRRSLQKPDFVLIDGCALLWVIHWPTSGTIADYIVNFTENVKRYLTHSDVYLVFDRYYTTSIKNETRMNRAGKTGTRQHQLNVNTLLPPQKVTLGVTENKVQLINILCQYLKDHCHQFTGNNRIVVTGKDPVPFEIYHGELSERVDLRTTHEEADVVIVQQMVKLAANGASSIDVICDDTDVFILLMHFFAQEQLQCDLVMSGTSAGRTVIDIRATVAKHADIVDQLLAAHVISGCDTVSQMYGIGKGTVLKVVNKHHTLNILGKTTASMDSIIDEAAAFVIACYGTCNTVNMSDARYNVWTSKMANCKLTSPPQLKTLPPTTDAFVQHVHRAHFQAAVWRSSLDSHPPALNPTDYGWSLNDSTRALESVPLPLDVSPAPVDVLQLIKCGCASDRPCSTARCSCFTAHLSCSMFCGCHGDYQCCNVNTIVGAAHVDIQEDDDDEDEDED